MNKKYFLIIFCLIFTFSFFNSVLATVGGPLFLSDFRYSKEDGGIYFIENYDWWSAIIRYDVFSLKKEIIANYGQIGQISPITIKFPEEERDEIAEKYGCPNDDHLELCVEEKKAIFFEKEKQRILNFAPLSRIDLVKNNIKINVSVVEQGEEGQYNHWGFTQVKFIATIVQNNLEKGKIEFYGYYRKDKSNAIAINFDAFLIPSTKTTLFLLGRRGQPDEGGYLLEEVFFVDGLEISYPDPLPLRRQEECLVDPHLNDCQDVLSDWFWRKGATPTKGGLFVEFTFDERDERPVIPFSEEAVSLDHSEPIEAETLKVKKEDTDSQNQQGKSTVLLLIAGAILAIAVLFLFLLYLKKKQKISGTVFAIILSICLFLLLIAFFFPKKCGGAGIAPGVVCECFGFMHRKDQELGQPVCFGVCHSCWDVTAWLDKMMRLPFEDQ